MRKLTVKAKVNAPRNLPKLILTTTKESPVDI